MTEILKLLIFCPGFLDHHTDQVDELMKKGYEDSINVLKKIT
jgi:hypothetical protein